MKYTIEKGQEEKKFYVLYKKNWFSRWKYVRNKSNKVWEWKTEKGAKNYIDVKKLDC